MSAFENKDTAAVAPVGHRLTKSRKAAYGVAEIGIASVEVFIRYYLLLFYTETVGLRPDLAGYAIALGIAWDAISDPFMGFVSDKTSTPWGNRHPYIFAGGFLLCFSVIILFNPPALASEWHKFFYLAMAYILLNTSMTILNVPYSALGGELTQNSNEVSEVFGWRFIFGNIGMMLATVIPIGILSLSLSQTTQSAQNGIPGMTSFVLGVLVVLASWITLRFSKPVFSAKSPRNKTYRLSPKTLLENKLFLPLFGALAVGTIGVALWMALALHYYTVSLRLGEAERQWVLTTFVIAGTLSVPLWIHLSKKIGKVRTVFFGILLLGLTSFVAYPFLPQGCLWLAILAVTVTGTFAGSTVLLDSVLTDVVDYDTIKQGVRRLGYFFGFWKMGGKFSRAVALALTGELLYAIGYTPGTQPSDEMSTSLAWLFGPGTGIWFLVATLFLVMLLGSDRKMAKIKRILARREKRLSSLAV